MKSRAVYLEDKVRDVAQSLIDGKLITLESYDCDDGFGVGHLPSYTRKAIEDYSN